MIHTANVLPPFATPERLDLRPVSAVSSLHNLNHRDGHNEDKAFAGPRADHQGTYVVSDAMGGHPNSEQAAVITVGTISNRFAAGPQTVTDAVAEDTMKDAILTSHRNVTSENERRRAGQRLRRQAADSRIGATVAAMQFYDSIVENPAPGEPKTVRKVVIGTVGDSRVVLFRGGMMYYLTLDHSNARGASLAQQWDDQKALAEATSPADLTEAQLVKFATRNLITEYMGKYRDDPNHPNDPEKAVPQDPDVRTSTLTVFPGDRIGLLTDGVHDILPGQLIAWCMGRYADPQQRAAELTRLFRQFASQKGSANFRVDGVKMYVTQRGQKIQKMMGGKSMDDMTAICVDVRNVTFGPGNAY